MGKRIKSFLTALLLIFTSFSMFLSDGITARAEGGVVINLHYNRPDGNYDGWSVWFWEEGKDGADYPFTDVGGEMVASMEATPGTVSVGFIVRTQAWDKDVSEDQFIDISEMVSGSVDVYVESTVAGYEKKYGEDAVKGTKLKTARYDGKNKIIVTMTGEIAYDFSDAFSLASKSGEVEIEAVKYNGDYEYEIELKDSLVLSRNYSLKFVEQNYKVMMPIVYSTDEFEAKYTYNGDDLGAVWTKDKTTFRVWAPTADSLSLRLFKTGDARSNDKTDEIPMTPSDNGTWVTEVSGDLNGTYYTYLVTIDDVPKETCDPYARTTGINGNRAMVIDLDSTDPEGWDSDVNPHAGEPINDAIIYEAHIRDLTTDKASGIENPGKFIGVAETGRKTETGVPTGLDHIKDLGVTHVHILPMYDFASVDEIKTISGLYNWGYDPQNYNVPEGSYSTDAYNGEVRVKEAKEMIKALHDNGLSVVMDVVYNHVNSASDFCFNKLVPGYFSRISETGAYSSGSGCGNDTASERSMVRKYIVDSVCYWVDEYHIDGFRFDLVGLIDVDTVNAIIEAVHKDHPDVIFYGEGWSMTTAVTKDVELATQKNAELTPGFAFFNDTIRDGIKGSVFNTGTGFVSGSAGDDPKISRCFIGLDSWCPGPAQTINYASCHDNNTLYDRLKLSRPDASEEELQAMNKLAAAIYLTSEGVPFMQAGEEMLRSKVNKDGSFNENSYNAGDEVNKILYSSLDKESTNNVYNYYKGLIEFRKNHKALRMQTAEDVNKYISELKQDEMHVLAFEIDGSFEGEVSDKIMVIFNATEAPVDVALSDGEWDICINGEKAGTESLGKATATVKVDGVSAMVLCQGKLCEDKPVEATKENGEEIGVEAEKNGNLIPLLGIGAVLLGAGGVVIARSRKKKENSEEK